MSWGRKKKKKKCFQSWKGSGLTECDNFSKLTEFALQICAFNDT